jgi:hypothetical protein
VYYDLENDVIAVLSAHPSEEIKIPLATQLHIICIGGTGAEELSCSKEALGTATVIADEELWVMELELERPA